jgi:hypothetical protein
VQNVLFVGNGFKFAAEMLPLSLKQPMLMAMAGLHGSIAV